MAIETGADCLIERIKVFGADVYAGSFPTLRDRVGHTIAQHRIATVIAGPGPDGKSETFGHAFKRIYRASLPGLPPGTQHEWRR